VQRSKHLFGQVFCEKKNESVFFLILIKSKQILTCYGNLEQVLGYKIQELLNSNIDILCPHAQPNYYSSHIDHLFLQSSQNQFQSQFSEHREFDVLKTSQDYIKLVKTTFFIIPQQLRDINIYVKFTSYDYDGGLFLFDIETLQLEGICRKVQELFSFSVGLLRSNQRKVEGKQRKRGGKASFRRKSPLHLYNLFPELRGKGNHKRFMNRMTIHLEFKKQILYERQERPTGEYAYKKNLVNLSLVQKLTLGGKEKYLICLNTTMNTRKDVYRLRTVPSSSIMNSKMSSSVFNELLHKDQVGKEFFELKKRYLFYQETTNKTLQRLQCGLVFCFLLFFPTLVLSLTFLRLEGVEKKHFFVMGQLKSNHAIVQNLYLSFFKSELVKFNSQI
jgi:hypothetical protein